MYPTGQDQLVGQTRWASRFVVLDFDYTKPHDLVALCNTLEGRSIYAYLTCGTTGRGCHLIVFFRIWIPQRAGHACARAIGYLAQAAGHPWPEVRPSRAAGRGAAILLSYRGAWADGYGINPLLDPMRDLSPVHLADTGRCYRTGLSDLAELLSEPIKPFPRSERPKRGPSHAADSGRTAACDLLHEELARIESVWKQEGHRQDLMMGVAAFALRGLGMPLSEVEGIIRPFLERVGDREVKRRCDAIRRTAERHQAGEWVAWHYYYELSGVEPPRRSSSVTPAVVAKLQACANLAHGYRWQGNSGKSDRALYCALLDIGYEHGLDHPDGVLMSVSTRDMALRAGISTPTRTAAEKRLKKVGLIRRYDRGGKGLAGKVLLLVGELGAKLTHSTPETNLPSGGLKEWVSLNTHPAFRRRFLNPSALDVLRILLGAKKPLSLSEINTAVGKDRCKACAKLLCHNIILERDGLYECPPDLRERLDEAARTTGALRARDQQQLRYQIERDAYHTEIAASARHV